MVNEELPIGGYEGITWMVPCKYTYLSSPFGMRYHPTTGKWSMHNGIDLAASAGTPIYSLQDGEVTDIVKGHETAGNYVRVLHKLKCTNSDGDIEEVTYQSRYLHMSSFAPGLTTGMTVKQGSWIGNVGSTGRSTGPHLHLGLRRNGVEVDPAKYIFGTEEISTVAFWEHEEKESIKHDEWLPLYSSKGGNRHSTEGTSEGLFSRRQHIISNYTYNILNGIKSGDRLFGGISDIGLNVGNKYTSSVTWDEAVSQYYSKSSGYRTGELPKNLRDNDEGPWIVMGSYIAGYLSGLGWCTEAICALLGNMGAECGMNPARWECNKLPSNVSSYGGGFGLIQWTPGYSYFSPSELRDCVYTPPKGTPYDVERQLIKIRDELDDSIDSEDNGGVYFVKHWSSPNSYEKSIQSIKQSEWEKWKCHPNTKNFILNYLSDLVNDRCINVTGKQFKNGNPQLVSTHFSEADTDEEKEELTEHYIALLTIGYALNRERPSAKYWSPQKRIGYAQRFYRLLFKDKGLANYVFSTDPTENPCPDISKCSDIWKSKHIDENYINPYPVVSGKECVLPSNNAYCWGIAHNNINSIDTIINLSENYSTDWFDYNRENTIYDYGYTPRSGCIACWTYKNYDSNNTKDERSCVGYVTDVLGSDALKISWIKHKPGGYTSSDNVKEAHNGKADVDRVLTNYNNNWGLDTKDYKFRGFIYLKSIDEVCSNITIEDEEYCVQSNSATSPYSSITIALNDSKHYNKLRLIYDVEIFPPQNEEEDFDLDVYNYCNRYIFFSQRIVNTDVPPTNEYNEVDFNSKLPTFLQTGTNSENKNNLFLSKPFPKGHLLVSNSIIRGKQFKVKHIDDRDMLYIEDVDETFDISKFRGKGVTTELYSQDIDNPQDKEHELTQYFDREFPSYINIVTMAKPYKKGNAEFNSNIKLRIKKVILYR